LGNPQSPPAVICNSRPAAISILPGRDFDSPTQVACLSFPKIISARIGAMRQNHRMMSRDNLDENGGGNQSLKRRPVAAV
jgi:hypothetical protein